MKKRYILPLALVATLMLSTSSCNNNIREVADNNKESVTEKTGDTKSEDKGKVADGNTPEPGDTTETPDVAPDVPVNPVPVPAAMSHLRQAKGVEELKGGRSYFDYSKNGAGVNLFHDYTTEMPPVTPDNYDKGYRVLNMLSGSDGVTIKRKRNANSNDFLYSEQFVFDRQNDQMFLGNVVQGSLVTTGRLVPLQGVKLLQPITISTPLVALGSTPIHSQTIRPVLSEYRDVLNNWLIHDFKSPATRTSMEIKDIKVSTESGTKSGFNIDGISEYLQNIGFKLDISKIKKRTNILVKFVQSAYSVAMDRPNGCLVMDLDPRTFNAGNDRTRPLYISNIEYGRAYYIMISSNYSSDEVKAAFNLSGKGPTEGSLWSVFSESFYKKVRDESVINASMIGGSSVDHGVLTSQGWEAFKQSLANNFELTAAEPIAIGLNFVDNNAPAQVHFTGRALTEESIFIPKCKEISVKLGISGVRATAGFKGIGKVRLYGKGYIEMPRKGRVRFFDIPQSQYLNLDKDMEDFTIPSGRPDLTKKTTVTTSMFGTPSSMERQLEKDVKITLELKHSGAYGGSWEDLGKIDVHMTLAEFLFYSMDGGFTLSTRDNRLMDFQGEIRVQMEPFSYR